MNELLLWALQNTLVALALAIGVYAFTRLYRNPPLAHLLWLLVLVKLVAPPLVHVGVPLPKAWRSDATLLTVPAALPNAEHVIPLSDRATVAGEPAATQAEAGEGIATVAWRWWELAPSIVFGCWLAGAVACALVTLVRIVRFERLVRHMLPASARLQQLNAEIARRLGVRRVPALRQAEGVDVPLLWCAGGRPTILLPSRLIGELDERRLGLILAHELAHLRRGDHRARALELLVSIAYWWNPLVPFIRRQLHLAEDQCCDAWVRLSYPDSTKNYAELLLRAAESLSTSGAAARLLPASRFLQHSGLKARIEMILESRFTPSVSRKSLLVVALAALLVLPSFLGAAQPEATDAAADRAVSGEAEGQPQEKSQGKAQDLDLEVQRARKNLIEAQRKAEEIEVLRRNGIVTGDASMVRNLELQRLQIQAMQARKNLMEAQRSAEKLGVWRRQGFVGSDTPLARALDVERATRELALAEVALAATNARAQLAKWQPRAEAQPAGDAKAAEARAADSRAAGPSDFPYAVKFEQGAMKFADGDDIKITEIRGTAETFIPGHIYLIKGTYKLGSQDKAMLAAYTTAAESKDGTGMSYRAQTMNVDRGSGNFTLFFPMACRGWPHVSFYNGQGFGGNYFGTGESVLKKWWGSKD